MIGGRALLMISQAHFHGDGNRDSEIVALEYKEMNEDISRTGSDKRWWDYRQLFNSHEARWRSFLVISQAFITQVSPNLIISYDPEDVY